MSLSRPFLPLALLLGAAVSALSASAAPFTVTLDPHDKALTCAATTTPALTISGVPDGTKSLAVIFWDQGRTLSGRWALYNLPPTTTHLPASPLTTSFGGQLGSNDAGKPGFSGPCLKGHHDLYVDVYAVSVPTLNVKPGTNVHAVHTEIHRHMILEAKAHAAGSPQ